MSDVRRNQTTAPEKPVPASGGAVVTGKAALTGKLPPGLDCAYSLNYLVARARGVAPPAAIADLGFDARNGWRDAWHKTPRRPRLFEYAPALVRETGRRR